MRSVYRGECLLDCHGGWALSSSVVLFFGDVAANEIGDGNGSGQPRETSKHALHPAIIESRSLHIHCGFV
jgi:hypothetical protein